MKTSRLICVAPIFLLASSGVFAQSSVDARVQNLEDTIRVLERRVAALEDQLHQQAPDRVASGKVNWRKLQIGMAKSDVEQLLGSPSKVDEYGALLYGITMEGKFNSTINALSQVGTSSDATSSGAAHYSRKLDQ